MEDPNWAGRLRHTNRFADWKASGNVPVEQLCRTWALGVPRIIGPRSLRLDSSLRGASADNLGLTKSMASHEQVVALTGRGALFLLRLVTDKTAGNLSLAPAPPNNPRPGRYDPGDSEKGMLRRSASPARSNCSDTLNERRRLCQAATGPLWVRACSHQHRGCQSHRCLQTHERRARARRDHMCSNSDGKPWAESGFRASWAHKMCEMLDKSTACLRVRAFEGI